MAIAGLILMGVGGIAALVGGIMVLIKAFQTSVIWGLGSLLIGPVMLIFVIMHWEESKKGFCISLVGSLVAFGGMFIAGSGAEPASL